MLKYLLLILVVLWLLYSPAVRGLLRGKPRTPGNRPRGPEQAGSAAGSATRADRIVPCAHCGVHLPLKEALCDIGGRTYCSEGHRNAGPRVS
jgi:uncharacterized protein